jgi:hypothetical protein
MNKENKKKFSWLKEPSPWTSIVSVVISIVAVVISMATFFIVYVYRGTVRVIIPNQVGVTLTDYNKDDLTKGDLSLVVPISLTNYGSPRTVRTVIKITLELSEIEPVDVEPVSISARWRTEFNYIGPKQYYKKYFQVLNHYNKLPSQNKVNKNKLLFFLHDRLDYNGRVAPFSIYGGQTKMKVLEFVQHGRVFKKEYIKSFKMRAIVETKSKKFTSEYLRYSRETKLKIRTNSYRYFRSYD